MINETLSIEESEEMIDYYSTRYPLTFKGLHFIGLGGAATAGQVFRWLNYHESDQKRCFLTITDLIGKNYVRKLNRSQLKKINQPENEIIFYVTEKGFNYLKSWCLPEDIIRHDSDLIAKQVKYGMPQNTKLYRVTHELLLAESILYWLDTHDFIFIKTEPKLISEYYKQWYEEERRTWISSMRKSAPKGFLRSPPGKTFPDYQIYLLNKENKEFWFWNCEIVHKMTLTQIKKKQNVNYWFCNSEKVSDLIETAKNTTPIILENLHNPTLVREALNQKFYAKNITSNEQETLMKKIDFFGGVVSCRLLAADGLKKDSYYRSQLEQLHRQGKLNKTSSCLSPGISRGNNENFYSSKEIDIISSEKNLRGAVVRTYLIPEILNNRGFRFCDYNKEYDACIFSKRQEQYIFLIDYDFESTEKTVSRIKQSIDMFPSAKVGITCLEYSRAKTYFYEFKDSILYCKLYKLSKVKSYRTLKQLHHIPNPDIFNDFKGDNRPT